MVCSSVTRGIFCLSISTISVFWSITNAPYNEFLSNKEWDSLNKDSYFNTYRITKDLFNSTLILLEGTNRTTFPLFTNYK